ncbi:enoyl-CoA hydratase/isomerase family protein [Streptomyces sp. NPDC052052]|uniref:enoyl-CoA hydratase/isomerase family protein n=1 Tax=Streptomyces sp. NPDC052052 TaxID=3154756 RepID=UPI0034284A6A
MPSVPVIGPAELAAGAAHEPLLGADARPVSPVLGVCLDEPASPDVLAAAAHRARNCDRVLVGVCEGVAAELSGETRLLAEALDTNLTRREPRHRHSPFVGATDPATALSEVARAVESRPGAALVLAGLLRATERHPVRDALDAESFAYSTLLGGDEFRRWLTARGPRRPSPRTADPVLCARDGGTLTITLNRPARRNAYDRHVRDALVEALTVAAFDPTLTRVLLTGAGPVFCSGGDLDEFGTAPDPVTAHLVRTRQGAGRLLHELRERVEARVHGTCVGSGIELPAFAAAVHAAPGTTFRLPEIGMGLIPGAGGTVSIPRRVGRWRTLHLALTGREIDAATALSWGLVDSVDAHPAP